MYQNRTIFLILVFLYSFLSAGYLFINDLGAMPRAISLGLLHLTLFALCICISFYSTKSLSVKTILIISIIPKLIVIFSTPIYENDFWRYMWDGHILLNGINPYYFPPNSLELNHLRIWYHDLIGFPDYNTIYLPVSIFLFALTQFLAPGSILGFKLLLLCFDLGTGVIIYKWLKRSSFPTNLSMLYFLNPLVLKEIQNSAHLDAIPVFFIVACTYFIGFDFKSKTLALQKWFLFILGVLSKSFPIILLPILWRHEKRKVLSLVFMTLFSALIIMPFLDTNLSIFKGHLAFAQEWEFNASLYKLIYICINTLELSTVIDKVLASKLVCVGLYATFLVYLNNKFINNITLYITHALGALLLLSPVANAWYVLWLLPFSILSLSISWYSFSFLVILSYSWFDLKQYALIIRGFEYLFLFLMLFLEYRIKIFENLKFKI